MSLLWALDGSGTWVGLPLGSGAVAIPGGAGATLASAAVPRRVPDPVLMRSGDPLGVARWLLLCAPGSRIRVNGARLHAGIRVLADRDAIALGDGRSVFFCAERLAEVVPFPGGDDATSCIRCKLPLEPGTPAVRCTAPGCGFWHHQCDDHPCWTYTTGCAGCGYPTAFDAGYQWSPMEL